MPLPLIPLIGAGAGLIQSLVAGGKARKAQKQLEGLASNVPQYKQNQSILDYYNTALSRYGVSPTDSAMYKRQQQSINRNVASGLNTLQNTRSAIGGASSLVRAANDASLNAEVAAEQQRDQRFGVLGGATGMKAAEDAKAFEQNVNLPYQLKYNLLSQKAGAANQTANAGLSNIFSGLQNWSNMQMMDKMYGTGKTPKTRTRRSLVSGVGYAPDFDNYGQPQ